MAQVAQSAPPIVQQSRTMPRDRPVLFRISDHLRQNFDTPKFFRNTDRTVVVLMW